MGNGEGIKRVENSTDSNDPKFIFKTLKSVEWIYADPILRYKLRELAFRWVEARNLVLGPEADFELFALSNSGGDRKSTKKVRSDSADSIVDIKSDSSNQPSPLQSSPSTPEADSGTSTPEPAATISGEWECRKCTFMNSAEATTSCAICGWFKSRSVEATGTVQTSSKPGKKDLQVLAYIQNRNAQNSNESEVAPPDNKQDDLYAGILSRSMAGHREQSLTGQPSIPQSKQKITCTLFTSAYNLVSCGQAQEESTWVDSLEKDLFAQHSLDEELIFRRRYLASKDAAAKAEATLNASFTPTTSGSPDAAAEINEEEEEAQALLLAKTVYAEICNGILTSNFPTIPRVQKTASLDWSDWIRSGVHTAEYLDRLLVIHRELVRESRVHFAPFKNIFSAGIEAFSKIPENIGRELVDALFNEPKCDLNLHLLSHVEGDNVMDRFLIPAALERGDLVYSSLVQVWESDNTTAFVAARPPGHHCPSFEDRLVGLSVNGVDSSTRNRPLPDDIQNRPMTKLEKQICKSNGLVCPPKECGMGFCSLNALSVAVRTFQRNFNPSFESKHGRSIRIAIVDLDIHAGNGTELVFRDNRSVLHISVHRYGWLKSSDSSGGTTGSVIERVMPGTHPYKDVGGMFGKDSRNPRGEGYAVNINLRKGDGNAEVMSSFEAVVIPVMQQFAPDIVVVPCGFDGLKLSPAFKQRWGEESCPGMDAEYTPSLYGYLIGRIRSEVQTKIVAVTEGGYDPIGVGLAARFVVKGLRGNVEISKPPMRVFNNEWLVQLNNIWQHQQKYWSVLRN